ncbi:GATA-binding factor 2 [Mortierella polycephala]|uniref:GATA-binding factor 2 n=1 Tax=Mortierella polycephala TaxID=41804 RepID=A0A9P6PPP0_9FUNG|nr:GATA-binding factor 2 [Mortierella polycephala]
MDGRSAVLQATLTQSRYSWTHTAFGRFFPEPAARGPGGKKYASEVTLAGVCTVCIGPHIFLDTKFYTVFNPTPPAPPSGPASSANSAANAGATTPTRQDEYPHSPSPTPPVVLGGSPAPERVIELIMARTANMAAEAAAAGTVPETVAPTHKDITCAKSTANDSTMAAGTSPADTSTTKPKTESMEKTISSSPNIPTASPSGAKSRIPPLRPQRPKHQVAFEFKENPGLRWLFPHESSLELTSADDQESAKISASFYLPTLEEPRTSGMMFGQGSGALVPGPGQATTMVILQATTGLWTGLQHSINDPAATYRFMMDKMKSIQPRCYVQYNLPIDYPDEQLHPMGLKKLPDHKVVTLTSLQPSKRQPEAMIEQGVGGVTKVKRSKAGHDELLVSNAKGGATSKKSPASGNSPTTASGQKRCTYCDCTTTPMWRRGPNGPRTLCNACGVKWSQGKIFVDSERSASPSNSVSTSKSASVSTPVSTSTSIPTAPTTVHSAVATTTTAPLLVPGPASLTTTADAAAQMSKDVFGDEGEDYSGQFLTHMDDVKMTLTKRGLSNAMGGDFTNGSRLAEGDKTLSVKKRGVSKASSADSTGPKMVPIHQIGETAKQGGGKAGVSIRREKESDKDKLKEKTKARDKEHITTPTSGKSETTSPSSLSASSSQDASANNSNAPSPTSSTPTAVSPLPETGNKSAAALSKSAAPRASTSMKVSAAKATTATVKTTKQKGVPGKVNVATTKPAIPVSTGAKISLLAAMVNNAPRYQVSHPPATASTGASLADEGLALYPAKNLYTNNTATFPLHFPTISIAFGPSNAYYMYPNCAVVLFENHFQIKLIDNGERTDIDVRKEEIEETAFQVVDVGDGESMIVMKTLLRQHLTRFNKELLNPNKNETHIVFRFRERLDGGGPPVKPLLEQWLTTEIPVAVPPLSKAGPSAATNHYTTPASQRLTLWLKAQNEADHLVETMAAQGQCLIEGLRPCRRRERARKRQLQQQRNLHQEQHRTHTREDSEGGRPLNGAGIAYEDEGSVDGTTWSQTQRHRIKRSRAQDPEDIMVHRTGTIKGRSSVGEGTTIGSDSTGKATNDRMREEEKTEERLWEFMVGWGLVGCIFIGIALIMGACLYLVTKDNGSLSESSPWTFDTEDDGDGENNLMDSIVVHIMKIVLSIKDYGDQLMEFGIFVLVVGINGFVLVRQGVFGRQRLYENNIMEGEAMVVESYKEQEPDEEQMIDILSEPRIDHSLCQEDKEDKEDTLGATNGQDAIGVDDFSSIGSNASAPRSNFYGTNNNNNVRLSTTEIHPANSKDQSEEDDKSPDFRTTSFLAWFNYLQVGILVIEFLQLFSFPLQELMEFYKQVEKTSVLYQSTKTVLDVFGSATSPSVDTTNAQVPPRFSFQNDTLLFGNKTIITFSRGNKTTIEGDQGTSPKALVTQDLVVNTESIADKQADIINQLQDISLLTNSTGRVQEWIKNATETVGKAADHVAPLVSNMTALLENSTISDLALKGLDDVRDHVINTAAVAGLTALQGVMPQDNDHKNPLSVPLPKNKPLVGLSSSSTTKEEPSDGDIVIQVVNSLGLQPSINTHDWYLLRFWSCFVVVIVGWVVALSIHGWNRRCRRLRQKGQPHWPAISVGWVSCFIPVVSVLYLPILSTFLSSASCQSQAIHAYARERLQQQEELTKHGGLGDRPTADILMTVLQTLLDPGSSSIIHSRSASSLLCTGPNIQPSIYLGASLIAYTLSYVLFMVFLTSFERAPAKGEICFRPNGVAALKNLSLLLAMDFLLIQSPTQRRFRGLVSMAIMLVMACYTIRMKPCYWDKINYWRTFSFSCVLYASLLVALLCPSLVPDKVTDNRVGGRWVMTPQLKMGHDWSIGGGPKSRSMGNCQECSCTASEALRAVQVQKGSRRVAGPLAFPVHILLLRHYHRWDVE